MTAKQSLLWPSPSCDAVAATRGNPCYRLWPELTTFWQPFGTHCNTRTLLPPARPHARTHARTHAHIHVYIHRYAVPGSRENGDDDDECDAHGSQSPALWASPAPGDPRAASGEDEDHAVVAPLADYPSGDDEPQDTYHQGFDDEEVRG